MAVLDACNFLEKCRMDGDFRMNLYTFDTTCDLVSYIKESGFTFSDLELGNAVNSLKLKANDEFEADEYEQLGNWYEMLAETSIEQGCSTCSTPCK